MDKLENMSTKGYIITMIIIFALFWFLTPIAAPLAGGFYILRKIVRKILS